MSQKVPEELTMFNDIYMLNWAWVYETEEGEWKQFDCLQCMMLESKWHKWKKDDSVSIKLWVGTIDFKNMTYQIEKDGEIQEFKILRTENKNRQRPDPESRHVD